MSARYIDPEQTLRSAASDLGLYCLLRPFSSNTQGNWILEILHLLSDMPGSAPETRDIFASILLEIVQKGLF